jgi:hypothetical protein
MGVPAPAEVTASEPWPSRAGLRRWSPVRILTVLFAGLLTAEVIASFAVIRDAGDLFIDFTFYRQIGTRWLADGTYYLPHQLTGVPYGIVPMEDVLYPPTALFLFVPLTVVPPLVWWIVPVGILVATTWLWRPRPIALLAMLLLLIWPRAESAFIFGNSDMWMAAGIAAGLRWGWPALILVVKPIFLPLAALGASRVSWWVGAGVLVLVSLAMLPLWLQYVTAMRTLRIGLDYSLGSLPLLLVPITAWLGRDRTRDPVRSTAEAAPHP